MAEMIVNPGAIEAINEQIGTINNKLTTKTISKTWETVSGFTYNYKYICRFGNVIMATALITANAQMGYKTILSGMPKPRATFYQGIVGDGKQTGIITVSSIDGNISFTPNEAGNFFINLIYLCKDGE